MTGTPTLESMNLVIPGHLTLEPLDTPDGMTGWGGMLPFGSSHAAQDAAHDGIVVNVLLEHPDTEAALDLDFIAGVLADLDTLLQAGAAKVHQAVEAEPARYQAAIGEAFGLDDPELTFGVGPGWTLRFADCSLPVAAELGFAVYFDGREPIEVDDLADPEFVDHEH